MLLDVKDRFQQKLDEQGISLQWLWLDLRAERAVRSLLDPPAIPSAMVIKGAVVRILGDRIPTARLAWSAGGSNPKFALVHHEEQADTEKCITLGR